MEFFQAVPLKPILGYVGLTRVRKNKVSHGR